MLKRLVVLNLRDCKRLQNFPSVVEMDALKVLNLTGCLKVDQLPEALGRIRSLTELHVDGTAIPELPSFLFKNVSIDSKGSSISKTTECLDSSITSQGFIHQLSAFLGYVGFETNRCGFFSQNTVHPALDIVCRGNSIPEWFANRSRENRVKVELPSDWCYDKFHGFGTCVVFKCKKPYKYNGYSVNNFDGASLFTENYIPPLSTSEDLWKDEVIWLRYRRYKKELKNYKKDLRRWKEANNFVTFSFEENNEDVEVKECGVTLICDEDIQGTDLLQGLPTPTQHVGAISLAWSHGNTSCSCVLVYLVCSIKCFERIKASRVANAFVTRCLILLTRPHKTTFYPENIVAIDMSYSHIKQLWTTPKSFRRLKVMKLRYYCNLTTTPDFSETTNLEELDLKGCVNLVIIHHSIGMLKRLVVLNLMGCLKVNQLPEALGWIRTAITKVPSLSFGGQGRIQPRWWTLITAPFGLLSKQQRSVFSSLAEILDLEGNNFISLPGSLSQLSHLKELYVDVCKKLEVLPELPPSVKYMNASDYASLREVLGSSKHPYSYKQKVSSNCPKLFKNVSIDSEGSITSQGFIHQLYALFGYMGFQTNRGRLCWNLRSN
nr:hypothetical protein [Tanacetum cinerariifolium]